MVKEGNIEEIENQEDEEEKKEKFDMMKKYYRNRYHSFLKALME
jgi:Zn/Cd-binding protein ZinT